MSSQPWKQKDLRDFQRESKRVWGVKAGSDGKECVKN